MIKKVLFYFLFIFSIFIYGQNDDVKSINTQNQTSIYQVSAFPNPFSIESQIIFYSKKPQSILFEVKNILGRRVNKTEIYASQGKNIILFLKKTLGSGMYIYSIQTDTETISKRLVIK